MNELFDLIENKKSDEVLNRIEKHIEPNFLYTKEFEAMKKKWGDYEMSLFLKVHTEERIIQFQKKDLTDFLEKSKIKFEVRNTVNSLEKNTKIEQKSEVAKQAADNKKKANVVLGKTQSEIVYKRNALFSILYFILSFCLFYGALNGNRFFLLYDGFGILLALFALIQGFWGIIVPYARLKENSVSVAPSIFKHFLFEFKQIKGIENESNKIIVNLENGKEFQIKKIHISSGQRTDFYNKINSLIVK